MVERETWTIKLRNNETGEIVEFTDEYGNLDDETFIWEEGNYACDCNRSLFFWCAKGLAENEVREDQRGVERFSVLQILNAAGEEIYGEEPS